MSNAYFPHVTPNHFSAADFVAFPGLSLDQEFDLIAPVLVYFFCDSSRKAAARKALTKLNTLGHPMMDGKSVSEIMQETSTLKGLHSRYNGLMMAIAESQVEGIESYIDPYGAYSFKVDGDDHVLMGDAYGLFAFYENAAAVRVRLDDAVNASVGA